MLLKLLATPVDKTIPTDLDPDFDVDWSYGTVLYDEELMFNDGIYRMRYADGRIRVVVLRSEYLEYSGKRVKDDSAFQAYIYAYDRNNGYGAIVLDGSMSEIDELGGLENFVYEIITNEKELFIDRGQSVCTGDMPDRSMEMSI